MRKNNFYCWMICIACTLLIFCNMGICNNGFSVWKHFAEVKENFTGAQGSSILTIRCIFSLISVFFVNRLYEKTGVRFGAFLGTILSAFAFLFYAIGGNILFYYIGAAFSGIGYGFGTTIAVSLLIGKWFDKKRGLAMGIATAGTGISAICFAPSMTALIIRFNLTIAFIIIGIFILLCAFFILFVVRDKPESINLLPYGNTLAGQTTTVSTIYAARNLTKTEWVFACIALILVGAVSTGGTGHFSILIISSGYSPEYAAGVFFFWGFVLIAAKFIFGFSIDTIGCKKSTYIFYAFYVAACILSLSFMTHNIFLPYIFSLMYGFGIAPATVGMPIWASDFSKSDSYARTLKWFQTFFLIGGILFTSLPGIIFDLLGNYQSAYMVFASFTVINTTILLFLYRQFEKEKS